MNETNQEKSISERFAEEWATLGHNQRRFVIAMLESSSKKEAALSIGIKPDTAYRWNGAIDTAIELARSDIQAAALGILQAVSTKAAAVKSAGLDSENERVRQDVASEILDRNLGKPTQRSEVNQSGDVLIRVVREKAKPNDA